MNSAYNFYLYKNVYKGQLLIKGTFSGSHGCPLNTDLTGYYLKKGGCAFIFTHSRKNNFTTILFLYR